MIIPGMPPLHDAFDIYCLYAGRVVSYVWLYYASIAPHTIRHRSFIRSHPPFHLAIVHPSVTIHQSPSQSFHNFTSSLCVSCLASADYRATRVFTSCRSTLRSTLWMTNIVGPLTCSALCRHILRIWFSDVGPCGTAPASVAFVLRALRSYV